MKNYLEDKNYPKIENRVVYDFFLALVEAFVECYRVEQDYEYKSKCNSETQPLCINSKLETEKRFSFFLG